jgi:hypothetical protein
MGELAMWQQRVEEFVLDQVGLPPARCWRLVAGRESWLTPLLAPDTP